MLCEITQQQTRENCNTSGLAEVSCGVVSGFLEEDTWQELTAVFRG